MSPRPGPVLAAILVVLGLGLLVGGFLLLDAAVVADHDGTVVVTSSAGVFEPSDQHVRIRCAGVLAGPRHQDRSDDRGDDRTRPIYSEDDVLADSVGADDGSETLLSPLDDGLYVDRVDVLQTCDRARARRGGEAGVLAAFGFGVLGFLGAVWRRPSGAPA